jgi:pimeloyl-ACP methyl ester carboxylesterase
VVHTLQRSVNTSNEWLEMLFQRPLRSSGMAYAPLAFGDDLKGDFYYPENTPVGRRLPVAIWLHPFAYPTGYSRDSGPAIASLVRRGFAVMAFDQIGFGARVRDAREFYRRYPKWSLMGKMVADTRAAIDAATALAIVDPQRVSIIGYALGGKVGLLTAALDDRVTALAVVDGFDPLRLDTKDKGVEGIMQYSHLHGLIPRFGFFVGHEDRLPLDFDEALATIAPRPALVVAATLDRYARVEDVRSEVGQARRVYERLGGRDNLTLETPLEINRFPRPIQEQVFDWVAGQK